MGSLVLDPSRFATLIVSKMQNKHKYQLFLKDCIDDSTCYYYGAQVEVGINVLISHILFKDDKFVQQNELA